MSEHYFDNAATTRVCQKAIDAAVSVMQNMYGNPSSTHTKGREAKKLLDECREAVAERLGCSPNEVYFTSCGSESDNWAILCGADSKKHFGKHIISSMAEHDAVRKSLDVLEKQGYEITRLKPDKTGKINIDDVLDALREDTILVSLMLVNNETGAVNDIAGISKAIRDKDSKALIHTDAVQGFMKIPFTARELGVDLISISGHKVHAVKGVGALYIKNGVKLKPYISGGAQESGLRAGTEAMPQIASFAAACKEEPCILQMAEMKACLKERLINAIPELQYIESEAPHILNISMPGWRSEVIMTLLESKGVYVSKSSACKQGKRSHVLEAMGLNPKYIDGALRIGISRFTTDDDLELLVQGLKEARALAH